MVQGTLRNMGPIHSTNTSTDDQSSPNDLRLVRQEVEKLFAMDSHYRGHKPKGHENSNRWNILRFLESVNKETILGDEKSDITAASSCSSSPILPTFPNLAQYRGNKEDSCENLTDVKTLSPQYLRPAPHGLKKHQPRNFVMNSDFKKESDVFCESDLQSLPIEHSRFMNDDSSIRHTPSKPRSRPIPVSRRRVSPTNVMSNEESYIDDTAEENHLKQIHDLRTWEMYIRISEARKKAAKSKAMLDNRSKCISNSSTLQMPHVDSRLQPGGQYFNMNQKHMIPFLPKEDTESEEQPPFLTSRVSEHEMIFGDLDD